MQNKSSNILVFKQTLNAGNS